MGLFLIVAIVGAIALAALVLVVAAAIRTLMSRDDRQ